MAGAGYKLFNTGDVLLASEVNTYLQQQTVMVFASSAARTTALSGVLAEGMMSYLQDTNSVEVYNGSSWVNVGNAGDITGVTAGTGISGGGSSGDVTITNSMATAIDAKGDLIVGTGADTFSRLAVGTNNYVLTAASGETTGLKWALAGGYTLLTSGNLPTNANTTTISGLSTAYQDLVIEIYGVTFGSAAGYGVQSSGSWGRYSGAILAADTSTGDSYSGTYPRFVDKTWTTQTANNMTIRVFNYAAAYGKSFAYWGFMADGTNTWGTTAGGGMNTASAIDTITIFSIFGTNPNFTAGSYKIWGVK